MSSHLKLFEYVQAFVLPIEIVHKNNLKKYLQMTNTNRKCSLTFKVIPDDDGPRTKRLIFILNMLLCEVEKLGPIFYSTFLNIFSYQNIRKQKSLP